MIEGQQEDAMVNLKDAQTGGDVFFVLCGLINGEDGAHAQKSGPSLDIEKDARAWYANQLSDGWYWMTDGMADPLPNVGPFSSRAEAERSLTIGQRRTAPGLRLLGHSFHPMSVQDWEAFGGAEPGTMIAYCEDGTTLLFCPDDNSIHEHLPEGPLALELSITEQGEVERKWTFKVVR